jgi:hypothetical protein
MVEPTPTPSQEDFIKSALSSVFIGVVAFVLREALKKCSEFSKSSKCSRFKIFEGIDASPFIGKVEATFDENKKGFIEKVKSFFAPSSCQRRQVP